MSNIFRCRLCLKMCRTKIDIFKGHFPKMIEILTGIKIDLNDDLPKTSCSNCTKQVKAAMMTRKHIIMSHKMLLEGLARKPTSMAKPLPRNPKVPNKRSTTKPIQSYKLINIAPKRQSQIGDISNGNFTIPPLIFTAAPYPMKPAFEQILIISNPKPGFTDNKDAIVKTEPAEKRDTIVNQEVLERDLGAKDIDIIEIPLISQSQESDEEIIFQLENTDSLSEYAEESSIIFKRKEALSLSPKTQVKKEPTPKSSSFPEKIEKPKLSKKIRGTDRGQCNICHKEVLYVKEHIRTIHTDPLVCKTCGAKTINARALRNHISYYHSNAPKYICEKCGKQYRLSYSLNLHEKKEHQKIKDFECHICGKKFFEKMHLKRHINYTHQKLKTFKCEHCGKDFGRRSAFVLHQSIHKDETPYACQMCGKSFKFKLSLKNHLKGVHDFEEEKKFFCTQCDKGYASEHALRAHSIVHVAQKCQYCSEYFTSEFMSRHLAEIHGEVLEMQPQNPGFLGRPTQ